MPCKKWKVKAQTVRLDWLDPNQNSENKSKQFTMNMLFMQFPFFGHLSSSLMMKTLLSKKHWMSLEGKGRVQSKCKKIAISTLAGSGSVLVGLRCSAQPCCVLVREADSGCANSEFEDVWKSRGVPVHHQNNYQWRSHSFSF